MKKVFVTITSLILFGCQSHEEIQPELESNSILTTSPFYYESDAWKYQWDLWTYEFSVNEILSEGELGEIKFERTECIINESTFDTIWPFIAFRIFEIEYADSIIQFENDRTMSISCCYPQCGATTIETNNLLFWSDPWSIECAFKCAGSVEELNNPEDYTRPIVKSIINSVKDSSETLSAIEFINLLPIKGIKN